MASAVQKYLLAPRVPNLAAGFVDDNFAVVDLRKQRRGFALASSAVTPLPHGIITPSFDSQNIQSPEELSELILQTVEAAGLGNKKKWSVALPEGAARTLVVTLESKPSSRRELNEVLSWKIERVIAIPISELRVSRQRLSPVAGHERYLITVARNEVLSEYEAIIGGVGWHAGLMLPRHLGEAQWLMWDGAPGDKMLVSANRTGFTALVIRNNEPILIRTYACEPESRTDELHRFALYYRDKLVGQTEPADLKGLMVIGGINIADALSAVVEATESEPRPLDPTEFGLDLTGEAILFDQLAGAAGLASLAWQ